VSEWERSQNESCEMEYILVWRREERYRDEEVNVNGMRVNTAHEEVEEEKHAQQLNKSSNLSI
jgi:hypothetical protein